MPTKAIPRISNFSSSVTTKVWSNTLGLRRGWRGRAGGSPLTKLRPQAIGEALRLVAKEGEGLHGPVLEGVQYLPLVAAVILIDTGDGEVPLGPCSPVTSSVCPTLTPRRTVSGSLASTSSGRRASARPAADRRF